MDSQVLDPKIASALDAIGAGIDALNGAGYEPLGARDAIAFVAELEVLGRRLSSCQLELLDRIDRADLYRPDGHATAKTMIAHVGKLSGAEALARMKTLRMMRALPHIRAAFNAGTIGQAQVDLLGRIYANKRVADLMADRQAWFLENADRFSYRDFAAIVLQWQRLMDQDGIEPANTKAHDHRDARLAQNAWDATWDLDGRYGSMQGASMHEIFAVYIAAEYEADWEKARAEHGDAACAAHLPRTDAQRRADALWQVFQDAVDNPVGATPVDFVHNIVWDAETYEEMVNRLDGNDPSPFDPDTFRCETLDGLPVEPTEAAVSSLFDSVRRVVIDASGVVIDMGRARFFTGNSRLAVRIKDKHCIWPGCHIPATQTQSDHLVEHTKGGRTNPDNGGPACGRHNRHKTNHGFTVHRTPDGQLNLYRPDGTLFD